MADGVKVVLAECQIADPTTASCEILRQAQPKIAQRISELVVCASDRTQVGDETYDTKGLIEALRETMIRIETYCAQVETSQPYHRVSRTARSSLYLPCCKSVRLTG